MRDLPTVDLAEPAGRHVQLAPFHDQARAGGPDADRPDLVGAAGQALQGVGLEVADRQRGEPVRIVEDRDRPGLADEPTGQAEPFLEDQGASGRVDPRPGLERDRGADRVGRPVDRLGLGPWAEAAEAPSPRANRTIIPDEKVSDTLIAFTSGRR